MKLLAAIVSLGLTASAAANLTLTEINLTTGEFEITNTATSAFTGTLLEWCIPFTYGTMESGGFTYAAGESRVYTATVSGLTADDLWIYLDKPSGFSDTGSVVTGVVFGSDQSG